VAAGLWPAGLWLPDCGLPDCGLPVMQSAVTLSRD